MLLKQEGVFMFSTDLSTRDRDGHVVVALRGELDLADDAAEVAAVLAAVAARGPQIIVDLAGLEIIDSSGVAALARGRKHARQAGGDLLLAAPQQRVMRILVITRLADGFSVYDSVEEAAVSPRHRMPAALPAPAAVLLPAPTPSAAVAALSTSVLSRRVGVAGKCSDTADDRCYPALSEDHRSREWVRYARAQCLGCTVRDECLELALRYETLTGASHGVWGGTAPNERKEMLARRRRTVPARRSRAQTLRGAAS